MFFIIRKIINLKINFYGLEDCHFSPNIFFLAFYQYHLHIIFFFKIMLEKLFLKVLTPEESKDLISEITIFFLLHEEVVHIPTYYMIL